MYNTCPACFAKMLVGVSPNPPELLDTVGLLTKYGQKSRKYDIIRGKGGEGMRLKYHMATTEDLVPENHFLRKLEAVLDLTFVYEETAHLYSRWKHSKYGQASGGRSAPGRSKKTTGGQRNG